jgi:hypothetical protein
VLVAGTAFAAGGGDIASAPVVSYGTQQFGNTATDYGSRELPSCGSGDSWWQLPVTAGDKVTIDYEGGVDYENTYPVGTTDFNVNDTNVFQQSTIGSNDKQEVVFTAPRTGVMPLEFWNSPGGLCFGTSYNDPGPYDFTVYVLHGMRLSLTATPKKHHRLKLRIAVHNPDGAPLTLAGAQVGYDIASTGFKPVGSTAKAGVLTAVVKVPKAERNKTFKLRVKVRAGGFLARTVATKVHG